jgi:hypothetical protein
MSRKGAYLEILSGEGNWLRLEELRRPSWKMQNEARMIMKVVLDGDRRCWALRARSEEGASGAE